MYYSSDQIMEMFAITRQTVLNWVEEFQAYLSPTANPGSRRKRKFTYEDLEVLTLIARYKDGGATFADIHPALKNGQRGEPPIDRPTIAFDDPDPTRLQQALQFTHQKLEAATQRIQELEEQIEKANALTNEQSHEITGLTAERDQLATQVKELQDRVLDAYRKGWQDSSGRYSD